jgi:lipopolysaccharide export system protein LptA
MAQQKSATKPSPAQAGSVKPAAGKQAAGSSKQAPGDSGEGPGGNLFGDDSKGRPKGPTEITATQEAQFDVKSRSGVFIGNVKVVDPQFTLTSDRLTVHLNKDEEGGGLNDAEALGNVVIVHINQPKAAPPAAPTTGATPGAKTAPAGSARSQQPTTSIGKAEKALYEAKDGSVTLTGWPQITQGGNTHIATSPGVKMVLFRDGRMQTFGGTRTLIEDRSTATNNPNANGAQ